MRRPRPHWRTLIGLVAGLGAFAATATLALTRSGRAEPTIRLAGRPFLGRLAPAPAPGPIGPEGVPIPTAPPLAPPQPLRLGEQIDAITCQREEQVAFHIHAHLRIFVRGHSRRIPGGIGAAPPLQEAVTPAGRFVAAASCFTWLHTHAADGIIHIESPAERTYTLGEFFDIWGQRLDSDHVGKTRGTVTAFVDGRVVAGDPRRITLLAHSQIQLDVGRPLVAAEGIAFPKGL